MDVNENSLISNLNIEDKDELFDFLDINNVNENFINFFKNLSIENKIEEKKLQDKISELKKNIKEINSKNKLPQLYLELKNNQLLLENLKFSKYDFSKLINDEKIDYFEKNIKKTTKFWNLNQKNKNIKNKEKLLEEKINREVLLLEKKYSKLCLNEDNKKYLLEIYLKFIETIEGTSNRRILINTSFYLLILLSLLTPLGYFFLLKPFFSLFLALLIMIFSSFWISNINNFHDINRSKFKVMKALSESLVGTSIYDDEEIIQNIINDFNQKTSKVTTHEINIASFFLLIGYIFFTVTFTFFLISIFSIYWIICPILLIYFLLSIFFNFNLFFIRILNFFKWMKLILS